MTTTSAPGKGNGVPWWPLFVAAIGLAIAFLVLSTLTFVRADDVGMTEIVWTRLVLILHGVEAIAFTAVGWLFGREVHRGEANVAKDQAADAKKNAADAKQEAVVARTESAAANSDHLGAVERAAAAETRGWRLAEAVRARSDAALGTGWADGSGGNERSAVGGGPSSAGVGPSSAGLDPLKDLADSLFPPG